MGDITLHFKTQRGQPYGSESRKCDRCGIMIWHKPPADGGQWTDEEDVFLSPPAGFVRCDQKPAATQATQQEET